MPRGNPSAALALASYLLLLSLPAYAAVDQATLDRLVEYAKQGCLSGTQFDFDANVNGNVTFRNPLKPGAEGKAQVNIRNATGSTAIFDQQLRVAADDKTRVCMQPYIKKIFNYILGDTTNTPASAFFLITGVDFGMLENSLKERVPNGKYEFDRGQLTYSYWHKLNSTTPLDLWVSVVIRGERVQGAVATWRGTWSKYNSVTCSESSGKEQLFSFLLAIWGRPYYSSHSKNNGTIAYFFRKEGIPIRVDVGEDDIGVSMVTWQDGSVTPAGVNPDDPRRCIVSMALALPTSCPAQSDTPSLATRNCGE